MRTFEGVVQCKIYSVVVSNCAKSVESLMISTFPPLKTIPMLSPELAGTDFTQSLNSREMAIRQCLQIRFCWESTYRKNTGRPREGLLKKVL